jgi:hypothetical protein
LQEEQKRERERVKELEKVSNPVDKEKLELKFDNERLKVKQKVKALVKKHADDIEKLKSS